MRMISWKNLTITCHHGNHGEFKTNSAVDFTPRKDKVVNNDDRCGCEKPQCQACNPPTLRELVQADFDRAHDAVGRLRNTLAAIESHIGTSFPNGRSATEMSVSDLMATGRNVAELAAAMEYTEQRDPELA